MLQFKKRVLPQRHNVIVEVKNKNIIIFNDISSTCGFLQYRNISSAWKIPTQINYYFS